MGIFDKWLKKAKESPQEEPLKVEEENEIHTSETEVIYETPKAEAYDGTEEFDEAEQYEETEEYVKAHMAAEVKQQVAQFNALSVEIVSVTYENFLESSLCQQFETIVQFIELLKVHYTELLSDGVSKESIETLYVEAKKNLEQLQTLRNEVSLFRAKDTILRNKIKEYTKVVKQINDKKLKGEEFEKVKNALMPSIEAVNKERDGFLKEEQIINLKLQDLNSQMAKNYVTCEQMIKNIN